MAACRRSGFSFLLVRSDRAGAAMTYPPVAALVKAADALLAGVTTHRGVMTFEFKAAVELKHALAALTVEPTPEQCESLAKGFHDTYERLAPEHSYKTNPDCAGPWESVPANNRALMIATCRALLGAGRGA